MMRVLSRGNADNLVTISKERAALLEGQVPQLAPKQVDQVADVSFQDSKGNHRLSFRYNKDLGKQIAHVIDNETGRIVKHTPTDTQVDHEIRIQRLMERGIDVKA